MSPQPAPGQDPPPWARDPPPAAGSSGGPQLTAAPFSGELPLSDRSPLARGGHYVLPAQQPATVTAGGTRDGSGARPRLRPHPCSTSPVCLASLPLLLISAPGPPFRAPKAQARLCFQEATAKRRQPGLTADEWSRTKAARLPAGETAKDTEGGRQTTGLQMQTPG